jgi:hypothetical protein
MLGTWRAKRLLQQLWIICPLSYLELEGESEAKIDLYKVFHRRIERMLTATDPVIAGLAKDSDMGSKPILESAADVAKHAIVRYVRRCTIPTRLANLCPFCPSPGRDAP